MYTDSHTHLYLDAFSNDRESVITRAIGAGVTRMFLPNIDSKTIDPLFELADRNPAHCFQERNAESLRAIVVFLFRLCK